MSPTTASLTDPSLRDALAIGLERPLDAETARLAEFLAHAFGPSALALIHYGSHNRPADARPESAYDFFVVVEHYADAYRSLHTRAGTGYSPKVAAWLNRLLPPNVISVKAPGEAARRVAKCAVLTLKDLSRACSPGAPDHFVRARLLQDVRLVWSRDPRSHAAVVDAVSTARAGTFDWGRPFLPPRFNAETYCHVLLATSYASEIRPEGAERAAVLVAAQRETLVPVYAALLWHLAAHRVLSPEGDVYRDLAPPGQFRKLLTRIYFARSKVRSTTRWLKYVVLYDDWLDYVVRKVERRSGVPIHLTRWERRWPLIFLWPRAVRFILRRPRGNR